MSEFLDDTSVEQVSDSVWRGNVTDRWNIGSIPNGGYLMAIAARVFREAFAHPDPLTITGHYVDKAINGPVELDFEKIREGRSVSTGCVRFMQEGQERVRFTASYGDLASTVGETWLADTPPEWPSPDSWIHMPHTLAIHERIDMRFAAEEGAWLNGRMTDKAEHIVLNRFADGTELDEIGLLFFTDCVPPTVFSMYGPAGWVPTIELTVQVRAKPAPGDLLGRFRTRYLTNGLLEEDGELWDSNNQLVALSRQLAKFRLPKK